MYNTYTFSSLSLTQFFRSVSMRTMSALNSRAGTPRTGTLNSRDLNMQHASFSSGSHTLERSHQGNSSSFDQTGRIDERDELEHTTDAHGRAAFQSFHIQKNTNMYDARQPRHVAESYGAVSGNNIGMSYEKKN